MKDFTPHEEALELKELGFNEPCFGFISEDSTFSFNNKITNSKLNKQSEKYSSTYKGKLPNRVAAPTYSQAFRFFREKYFIYHSIGRNYDYWTYELCEFKSGNKHIPTGFKEFDSHEEAELACLKKLIEIVKK